MNTPRLKTITGITPKELDEKVNKFIETLIENTPENCALAFEMKFQAIIGNLYCFITYSLYDDEEDSEDD